MVPQTQLWLRRGAMMMGAVTRRGTRTYSSSNHTPNLTPHSRGGSKGRLHASPQQVVAAAISLEAGQSASVQVAEGSVSAERACQLTATIAETSGTGQRPTPSHADGDPVPPLYHWTAFQTQVPLHELGPDGHPTRGHPSDLTITVPADWRRMFGGSSVEFHGGGRLGQLLQRRSKIDRVIDKPNVRHVLINNTCKYST